MKKCKQCVTWRRAIRFGMAPKVYKTPKEEKKVK
jgi:hypothetical protein